jgi:hypothetical protein
MNHNENEENEKFSEDPDEQMHIENEILKLKMNAQFGGSFIGDDQQDLPPEILNQFLQNVIAFEQNAADAKGKSISVFERIGKPTFRLSTELSSTEIFCELARANQLLNDHNMTLDICDGPYPDELIYTFITQELFLQEVNEVHGLGGVWHFIYEEFYPNHQSDIKKNSKKFFKYFFEQSFDEHSWELSDQFVVKEGKQISREKVLLHFQNMFQSFTSFKNYGAKGSEIKFEMYENERGMAHSSGTIKYDAVLENGETIPFEGYFILYMEFKYGQWSIVYFEMPGFDWAEIM